MEKINQSLGLHILFVYLENIYTNCHDVLYENSEIHDLYTRLLDAVNNEIMKGICGDIVEQYVVTEFEKDV